MGDATVGAYSTWQFSIVSLPLPVDDVCWIQLLLPKDLKYLEEKLEGTKIFGFPG